ncbi:flagellar assembly protein T N-terminal domain-containing protein [Pontibacter sp. JAM-7]|uniref:flagellar assembly protein T N-terminal domain-containing protein n=1 Tax=Pontibacter sp. JAM-7 TaxID=3366581 RepID=UPI003AF8ACB1
MLNSTRYSLVLLICWIFALPAYAITLEAEGQSPILGNDIVSARQAAIQDASQQAAMQAAVYVSGNQVVREGILEIDNMQVSTLGKVSNVELLDEKVIGTLLQVRIRAEVNIDEGCSNGSSNHYQKTIAFTGFPLLHPRQANHGQLNDMPKAIPVQLSQLTNQQGKFHALNATDFTLHTKPEAVSAQALNTNLLPSLAHHLNQPGLNFIASGIIRDLSMLDPRTLSENNFFVELYNRLDYRSRKHLRQFQLDLYIHDGYNGQLVWQQTLQTAGLWNLPPEARIGFNNQGFLQQDYGQKVMRLLGQAAQQISDVITCQPFKTSIIEADGTTLWLAAGQRAGLTQGDRLTVYRNETHFVAGQTQQRLVNTRQSLTIKQVQPNAAMGQINGDSRQFNIRPGDIVIAD